MFFKKTKKVPERVPCPHCGSTDTIHIAYGLIRHSEDFVRAVENHELYPGGCIEDPSGPTHHCYSCKKNFRL